MTESAARAGERPRIGVATAFEEASGELWSGRVAFVAEPYLRHIEAAGGQALLLWPDPAVSAEPAQALELLDGLLLVGGPDIDPARYGQRPHPKTRPAPPERDEHDLALARAAVERDLPLLGICRGMQVLDVALGGTLHQHLPDVVGHEGHHRPSLAIEDAEFNLTLAEGSLAAHAAGREHLTGKSNHHQGIRDSGAAWWSAAGRAPTGWRSPSSTPAGGSFSASSGTRRSTPTAA